MPIKQAHKASVTFMKWRQEYQGVRPILSMTRHIPKHQSFRADGDPGKEEVSEFRSKPFFKVNLFDAKISP